MTKKRILLHACCAPCTAGVYDQLKNDFDIRLFWYNPNIFPKQEHDRRLTELLNYCDKKNIKILVGDYSFEEEHKYWLNLVKGFEKEPEKGKRCEICYRMRLEATAAIAAQVNDHHHGEFHNFAIELSISPHKNAEKINRIGQEVADSFGLKYFVADFKKNDGYKKAIKISKAEKLYRQNYCGCEFSQR